MINVIFIVAKSKTKFQRMYEDYSVRSTMYKNMMEQMTLHLKGEKPNQTPLSIISEIKNVRTH